MHAASPRDLALVRLPRWLGAAALVMAAVTLLVGAVSSGSAVLAGLGAAMIVMSAGLAWTLVRRQPVVNGSARTHPDMPASRAHGPPVSGELVELRLEWAERRALAERARRRHQELEVCAARADAVRVERSHSLPAAAEAEEALSCAERDLAGVLELDDTLSLAISFLTRAQEAVHREIVPELTGLLRRWLPRLTDGRYTDVRMDPSTLAVEVCGRSREFRRAELLSHGTAEQIYLLLRVALALRLTAGHDTCPLILDDVTVHADPCRTHRVLDLLHALSRERQIVLFAHQEQVREWADKWLDRERDALIELQPIRAG